jgi:hypothetical protein
MSAAISSTLLIALSSPFVFNNAVHKKPTQKNNINNHITAWHGMTWHDMTWHDMTWHGMI